MPDYVQIGSWLAGGFLVVWYAIKQIKEGLRARRSDAPVEHKTEVKVTTVGLEGEIDLGLVRKLLTKVDTLEQELKNAEDRIGVLERRVDERDERAQRLEERIDELTAALDDRDGQIKRLKRQLREAGLEPVA